MNKNGKKLTSSFASAPVGDNASPSIHESAASFFAFDLLVLAADLGFLGLARLLVGVSGIDSGSSCGRL